MQIKSSDQESTAKPAKVRAACEAWLDDLFDQFLVVLTFVVLSHQRQRTSGLYFSQTSAMLLNGWQMGGLLLYGLLLFFLLQWGDYAS